MMLSHGLRVSLSFRKAIMYRGPQDATSKVKRNRSLDQIKATTGSASAPCAHISLRARQALINLGATAEERKCTSYQPPSLGEQLSDHDGTGGR